VPHRYYVVRWNGWTDVYVTIDYRQSHHYRAVTRKDDATSYEDAALAESAARFLGGTRLGFRIREEEE
jgi:hypothetical protein